MFPYFWLPYFFIPVFCYNIDLDNAIIYSLPRNTTSRLNYFGMSVAIRPHPNQTLSSSWEIQIGAPRCSVSASRHVTEPGCIYRCHTTGHCSKQELLETSENTYGSQPYDKQGMKLPATEKDHGWMGVAMDMADDDMTVVCGHHLWYQAIGQPLSVKDDFYLTIGGCFLVHSNGTVLLLSPLKNEAHAYVRKHGTTYFDWGLGLAGMSAHLADSGALLLGAPNIYLLGSVILYPKDFRTPFVVDSSTITVGALNSDHYAYNGYSVGSGRFFDDEKEWFVFGAPRAGSLHGRVYRFSDKENSQVSKDFLHGETYGEYFGASLAVGDVNGDDRDDLIVGAPFYSGQFVDQGRVYVFFGGREYFRPSEVLINGAVEMGRFGACVSVVGDLDKDGFDDVMVGAPSVEGRGAVYLYRGRESGLSPNPSQTILASQIHHQLKGFGISISRAVDVDSNNYLDILVGAYQSDQVVLLRTRSIIELTPSIGYNPRFLNRDQSSFVVMVCLPYKSIHGTSPPHSCVVDGSVNLDETWNRAGFQNLSNLWEFSNVKTDLANPYCQNLTIQLDMKNVVGTYDEPIRIRVKSWLSRDVTGNKAQVVWGEKGTLNLVPSIALLESPGEMTVLVPFAGDCGVDEKCQSHLVLDCRFANLSQDNASGAYQYVIGSSVPLILKVLVKNEPGSRMDSEPAHYTLLSLAMEGGDAADMIRLGHTGCVKANNGNVSCNLDTIGKGIEKSLSLPLATDVWTHKTPRKLNFSLAVSSSGELIAINDSKCRLTLDLISIVNVTLVTPPVTTIAPTDQSQHLVTFSHQYEILKNGPSATAATITLKVSIPVMLRGLSLLASPSEDDGRSVYFTKGALSDEMDVDMAAAVGEDRILYINCSMSSVTCLTVSSTTENLIVFNLSSVESLSKNFDVICYSTNGTVVTSLFGDVTEEKKEVSTFIVKAPSSAVVETRVIVLSALGGGLLLALCIPVLIREGFFRRKSKEQLEALKNEQFVKESFHFERFEDPSISLYHNSAVAASTASSRTSGVSVKTLTDDLNQQEC